MLIGGASLDAHAVPVSDAVLAAAKRADAVFLGAVGGPKWDAVDPSLRPEKALLQLRKELGLFSNLRPAILHPSHLDLTPLRTAPKGFDLLVVRELIGGLYFGEPRSVQGPPGERLGINTMVYSEAEIRRIAHIGFQSAMLRRRRLCSVDKANVLEVSRLWRQVVDEVATEYPQVQVEHLYVDNAAMQLVLDPAQFDVLVTGNLFGDILSDISGALCGSLGLLPSASLGEKRQPLSSDGKAKDAKAQLGSMGMYEPCHGAANTLEGQDIANPVAAILSMAMLLRFSLQQEAAAQAIEAAVHKNLE